MSLANSTSSKLTLQPDPSAPHEQPGEPPPHPAVRFASVNQEIEPAHSLQAETTKASDDLGPNAEISREDRERLRSISRGLQTSHLQQSRMSNFAFEPVSLPVSRVGHASSFFESVTSSGNYAC